MRLALIISVLAAFGCACGVAANARAAEGDGKITGKVINAATEAPIAGIEVCAFVKSGGGGPVETGGSGEGSGEEELFQCPTTAANGEYTISGLPSGEYIVGFGAPFMSELNYITQFYNGKSTFTEATPVSVAAGGTASGIDAKLAEGGRIAGKVSDASTGAAISGGLVCAFGANPETGGCALTDASGEYTIAGLPAGEYKVGFADPNSYVTQFYNGKATLAEATAVAVLVGSTASGIDAALVPKPPEPPGSTTLPSAPGAPTGPAKATGPTPRIKLASAGIPKPGRSRSVHVKLVCSAARCRGSVELTVQVVGRHREGVHVVLGPETLILAKGSFSLAAGKSARIALRLTAAGRRRLSRPRRHPLAAQLALSLAGGQTSVEPVRAG
jgi:hypothetical protein